MLVSEKCQIEVAEVSWVLATECAIGFMFCYTMGESTHSISMVWSLGMNVPWLTNLGCATFLNLNLYPAARTTKRRGGHVDYMVCIGVYSSDNEPELADYGQR